MFSLTGVMKIKVMLLIKMKKGKKVNCVCVPNAKLSLQIVIIRIANGETNAKMCFYGSKYFLTFQIPLTSP